MKRIAFFAAVLLGIAALFFCCRGGGIGAIGGGMAGGGRPGRNAVERLNDNQVFLKQEEPGSCTLCAAAMMLRRAAILSGDRRFWRIDEGEIKEEAWVEGQGLKHSFSYGEFQVEHEELPGGKENAPLLISELLKRPVKPSHRIVSGVYPSISSG